MQYAPMPVATMPPPGFASPVPSPMPVVPYIPPATSYPVVPYQAAGPVALRTDTPLRPTTPWLYDSEIDPNAGNKRSTEPTPLRKTMYKGDLWRPLMDEAYFCSHLASQTEKATAVVPGEVCQFQSSTGKVNLLTCINATLESPSIAWRILSDGRTNYIVFRGSSEWMYPLFDTKLAVLHDVAPKTSVKVHNMFLHDLVPHMPNIIASLKRHQSRRVVLTGFGNGAALATICFLLLQRAGFSRSQLIVYTFGAPLVTSGNIERNKPVPASFSRAIFNFVNEDDFIPCLLGNKDVNYVDALVSSVPRSENPLKNGLHNVLDIKTYGAMGKFYQLSADNRLVDVARGKEKAFLHAARTITPLSERLLQHNVDSYVAKFRNLVQDN